MYVHSYVGGVVPFTNPTGMLTFTEDSIQRINLTLASNDSLEVIMEIMHLPIVPNYAFTGIHMNVCINMYTNSYMLKTY